MHQTKQFSMLKKQYVLMLIMLCASIAAVYLTPTHKIAQDRKDFNLEKIIPTQFGDWKVVDLGGNAIVNPEQENFIKSIYSQNLSRTYTNSHGEVMMLVIAYGEEQSDSKHLHYPEVCYPAQGFQILSKDISTINWKDSILRVKRLFVNAGSRYEQITYWTVVGDKIVLTGSEAKLHQLKYGLRGQVPDGLLFRVSTINQNQANGFSNNTVFIRELLDAVKSNNHLSLIAGLKPKAKI